VTRQELTQAVGQRYRAASREKKKEILNEYVEVTGYHRKQAIRLLRFEKMNAAQERQTPARFCRSRATAERDPATTTHWFPRAASVRVRVL
jgi:hypothetical protein